VKSSLVEEAETRAQTAELQAKATEAEKRVLEAEYNHKKKELEDIVADYYDGKTYLERYMDVLGSTSRDLGIDFSSYKNLADPETSGIVLSDRTRIIASYALCGFANFASIGIQLGGIGGMAPERRKDLAKIGLRALVGGALASWTTACIAGVLL